MSSIPWDGYIKPYYPLLYTNTFADDGWSDRQWQQIYDIGLWI